MTDRNPLDPADRTPPEVRAAIGENQKAYPKDDCIPCGAVIHIGFFSMVSVVIETTMTRILPDTQIFVDFGNLIVITRTDVGVTSLTNFGTPSTFLDSERS